MTRFRALPMVVLTLSALVAGTAAGQTSKSAKARMARAARGNLFSIGGVLNANRDRKSTRLNSSHPSISYAVFCLKKKKKKNNKKINRILQQTANNGI